MPSSSDVLPGAAQARFTAAEGQLYPLALVDPDEYEQVTRVVGLLAAELRTEAPGHCDGAGPAGGAGRPECR